MFYKNLNKNKTKRTKLKFENQARFLYKKKLIFKGENKNIVQ